MACETVPDCSPARPSPSSARPVVLGNRQSRFRRLWEPTSLRVHRPKEKLAFCRDHGADETVNYATEDLKNRLKEFTGGKGVDVVYDPVGGDYSEQALRALGWEGRFLVIGFASGPIPKIPLNLPLFKRVRYSRCILGGCRGAKS